MRTVAPQQFAIDVMGLDASSVTQTGEDATGFIVTCRDHDGADTIETEEIHDLARQYDLRVTNTVADFDAGEVRLEVSADA
ncbi:hypothetical protein [Saliphagus sp. LR7]|uniref:hypothetical protein n=1 Tax=Saliphagus sp. LR7 TaxID=2282654 RepID=UPI000DF7AD90|nr:hypothetical protein [Saliphagus sp. LR7]